uniref:BED-type domain-containing protein n=1 Tax=Amphimedon queenslandica TaxID=400682 RepID=A0A1X7UD13_AMPQE
MAAISGEASGEAEETDVNDNPTLPLSIGSTITTSSDEVLSATLLPKPGTKSAIWQYFGLKANENGEVLEDSKAFCRLCSRAVMARSGNTSNLMAHVRNNHKPLWTSASEPILKHRINLPVVLHFSVVSHIVIMIKDGKN